jgi:threonine dehydrogenase-like Zn-dependent dehydrogenase
MSFEEAALCEPLSVALQARQRIATHPAEDILVIGAGTVGLLCAALWEPREGHNSITIAGTMKRDSKLI